MSIEGSGRSARSRLIRAARAVSVGAVFALGAGAVLHTSVARPLLARLASGHCPFARGSVDRTTRDWLRHLGLARAEHAGALAPARPALGFELGREGRLDVSAWASARALACRSESQGAGLACDGVPGHLLGQTDDAKGSLYFRFDAKERLVGVLRMRRTASPAVAVALASDAQQSLRASMGEPTRTSGDLGAVPTGALRYARNEHRFRDFFAQTAVTNLGPSGYLVTEESELVD